MNIGSTQLYVVAAALGPSPYHFDWLWSHVFTRDGILCFPRPHSGGNPDVCMSEMLCAVVIMITEYDG